MDDHFLFHFLLRCDKRPGWGWLYFHPSAPRLFRAEDQTKGLHMDECYPMFLVGKLSMKLHPQNAVRLSFKLRLDIESRDKWTCGFEFHCVSL